MTDRLPRNLRRRAHQPAVSIWISAAEPDPHEAAVLKRWWDNVPGRRQCAHCAKKATAACGCCCGEHSTDTPGDTA
jgi:hypothetical protein